MKETTIYDIARELNISAATVSRALKNKSLTNDTQRKVLAKAEELGYRANYFASNLRKRDSRTIGVIIPKLNSHFVSTAIAAMEKVASEHGYNIIISQSMESTAKEIVNTQTMFNNRVDGLIVSLAYDTETIQHFNKFNERKIPVIFFDRVFEHTDNISIIIDNYRNAYDITKHLINQGCKRIAHLTANTKRNVYSERFKGYKQALADNGIKFSEPLLFLCDLTEISAVEAGEKMMAMRNPPDALFACNDSSAANCMKVFRQHGFAIPKDIAVAGFNNDPVSRMIEPNITTVNYPAYQMGEAAASYMINCLAGAADVHITNKLILKSEVIIRASSMRKR